jgi:hypothetical protein
VDVAVALSAHDRLWEQRAAVLRDWQQAARRRDGAVRGLERHLVAREAALIRAAGGLTARQRAWAEQHATYATRPTDRSGRQVVVTWTYYRHRIEATAAKWAPIIDAATAALSVADVAVADATAVVLAAWGKDAPQATGRTQRQLRSLASRHPPAP